MSAGGAEGGAPAAGGGVTIVTQTRVIPGNEDAFAQWQRDTSETVARFPGFIEQTVLPPSPPAQLDWVILQRFSDTAMATSWLKSKEREERVSGIRPMLIGRDDVHIVSDGASGVLPAPVSAVISTRVKPGHEAAYRDWEQRIAIAQSKAPGFQGYRFEPPVAGVQEDWLAILRFDSEAHLQAWLDSPERQKLLKEAQPFTEEFHARVARTGFDQWFTSSGGKAPAAWKQNMVVLLMLYPIAFLFGVFVQTPVLSERAGLPFAVALFVGNVVSTILLAYVVPWASDRLSWWLHPAHASERTMTIAGSMLVVLLYAGMVLVFSRFF